MNRVKASMLARGAIKNNVLTINIIDGNTTYVTLVLY